MFPNNQIASLPLIYDQHFYRFCCSISWRVLTYLKLSEPDQYVKETPISKMLEHNVPLEDHQICDSVRDDWAQATLKGSPHKRDQHILFLNGKNVPFERSDVVGFTVFKNGSNLATVAILGPVFVIGFIRQGTGWLNTEVDPLGSAFAATNQSIPLSFGRWLHDLYLNIAGVAP